MYANTKRPATAANKITEMKIVPNTGAKLKKLVTDNVILPIAFAASPVNPDPIPSRTERPIAPTTPIITNRMIKVGACCKDIPFLFALNTLLNIVRFPLST